jgi:hypothetical protein
MRRVCLTLEYTQPKNKVRPDIPPHQLFAKPAILRLGIQQPIQKNIERKNTKLNFFKKLDFLFFFSYTKRYEL